MDETALTKAAPDIKTVLQLDEGSTSTRSVRRYLAWTSATVAAGSIVYVILLAFGGDTPVRYVTEAVSQGDLTVTVTTTGTVQPTNTVDVSSELSGVIRKVAVDYNSEVKAGDVLAELDSDKLKAQVEHSRATLTAAKAKVAEAEATVVEQRLVLQRREQLVARQTASQQDLDAARASYDRAVAGLASARAQVAVAEADLKVDETTGNLDTATSREIMELLTRLHSLQRITVIMVNHEHEMAAYAQRVIRFVDGTVESDRQSAMVG